jgi:hypothetical protein
LYIKEDEPSHESLAALGELTQLEGLKLFGPELKSDGIRCLADLTNLKTLRVQFSGDEGAFSQLPALPQLEAIQIEFSMVGGLDLRRLAILPRLRSLDLKNSDFGWDTDLGDLGGLNSLEELTLSCEAVSAARFESLAALKRLKLLHIAVRTVAEEHDAPTAIELDDGKVLFVLEREMDNGFSRALHNLRQSHPGLVIDGDEYAIDRRFEQEPPWHRIKYDFPAQPWPPWDKLERSDLLSTWLPRRLAWLPPAVNSQIGVQASGPAGGIKQQENAADRDE